MGNDKSPVDFVLTVLITCGKKAVVVRNAANSPINCIKSMVADCGVMVNGRQGVVARYEESR